MGRRRSGVKVSEKAAELAKIRADSQLGMLYKARHLERFHSARANGTHGPEVRRLRPELARSWKPPFRRNVNSGDEKSIRNA